MKLDMESEEIEDTEMNVISNADPQNKDKSVVNSSAASTSQPTTDATLSNTAFAEEFSKEVIVLKEEDFEVLGIQNSDSKSEDSLVTSTSESNSSECQEYEESSEILLCRTLNLAAAEVEKEGKRRKHSEISMAEASDVQDLDNATALTSQSNINGSCPTKMPSEESLSTAEKSTSIINITDSKSHRPNVHYSSESSDYESDESSDSSDCDEFFENMRKSAGPIITKFSNLTTKGELTMEDLPPVEDLHITVNATDLVKMGEILHPIVFTDKNEILVVIKADGTSNPLDADSVLFLSPDNPLGKIYEVFGGVSSPFYSVRFNNAEDISNKGVTKNQDVYYSVVDGELTRYVLVDVLKQQKGSDASWKDNNEPPPDEIDYSDDEQERLAKQKRRAKTRGKERNWNGGEGEGAAPNKIERKDATYRQERVFKRASRNQFQSPTPGPSRSSPRPYSPQNFGPPPIPSVSPQPVGLTTSNSIPFLERNVRSPQSFGPFSQRNVPSPQPFGLTTSNSIPFLERNGPSPQSLGSFSQRNVPSPQPFELTTLNSIPYIENGMPFLERNVPSPQSFGPLPHRNVPSPQPFGPFPQSSVSSHQHFNVPPTSYVVAPPTLALSHAAGAPQLNPPTLLVTPQNNVPFQQPPKNFGSSGLSRNVVSPQPYELVSSNSNPFLQRNVPPPQMFGQFTQNNVPSSQLFRPPPHHNAPSLQPLGPFPQASGSSFQQVTAPPTSYVLSHAQLNPSAVMAAPRINVPLQQQLLLQSHQPGTSFLSRPPPNYISHQNSRPGYHRP